jgi:hypothetical protein
LVYNKDSIEYYVDNDELVRSNRLGITFTGVKNKFLISYDIEDEVKKEIAENKTKYKTSVLEESEDYSRIEFSVPSLGYKRNFCFKSGLFIAPSTFYSRDWKTDTSKYFIFRISEPRYFNRYCMKKLDEFVDKMSDMLQFTEEERQKLEKEKIYYILCKDNDEIQKVSGFNTRGIYITAFDEIITTYNTHYHELAHLLINYKLKNLSLYTLPFFMEGFAVAVGGRGGLAPRVVTDIGLFLQVKNILTYDSILSDDAFYKEDASVTYPVAGLYNLFLLNELDLNSYLKLYRKVNGDLDYIKNLKMDSLGLPPCEHFLQAYYANSDILPFAEDTFHIPFGNFEYCKIDTIKYHRYLMFDYEIDFLCGDFGDVKNNFCSLKCIELFPKEKYKCSPSNKYVVISDSNSINLYNLYTNELSASYNLNFSITGMKIKHYGKSSSVVFWIKDSLIDGNNGSKWFHLLPF